MKIRKMQHDNYAEIVKMVKEFYQSDAVDHNISEEVVKNTLEEALSDSGRLDGYLLEENGETIGFAYVTIFYACEVGGSCVMLEEIYLNKSCRGKGYGTQFFEFLFQEYKDAKRFRLEVTKKNEKAAKLYQKLGFKPLNYVQMIRDSLQ